MKLSSTRAGHETNTTHSVAFLAPTGSRQRKLLMLVATTLAFFMAFFAGTTAAQAHDALESTNPADGASVATMPAKIALTFSNTPAAIGAEIRVLDANGSNWSQGSVEVLDQVASQSIKAGAPAGKYSVEWRVVSSDSHPIEGKLTFTTQNPAAGSGGAVLSTQQAIETVSESAAPVVKDSGGVPWAVYGLIVVLIGVVIAMVVVTRKRLKADSTGTPGSQA